MEGGDDEDPTFSGVSSDVRDVARLLSPEQYAPPPSHWADGGDGAEVTVTASPGATGGQGGPPGYLATPGAADANHGTSGDFSALADADAAAGSAAIAQNRRGLSRRGLKIKTANIGIPTSRTAPGAAADGLGSPDMCEINANFKPLTTGVNGSDDDDDDEENGLAPAHGRPGGTEASCALSLWQKEMRVKFAAVAIYFALHGNKVVFDRSKPSAYVVFMLYRRLVPLFIVATLINISVSFVERPLWCFRDLTCGSPDLIWFGLPVFDIRITLSVELVCILVLSFQQTLEVMYRGVHDRAVTARMAGRGLMLMVALLDISISLLLAVLRAPTDSEPGGGSNTRLAPYIRPILFILVTRRIRTAFFNLVKAFPSVLKVAFMMLIFTAFYVFVGVLAFGETVPQFSTLYAGMKAMGGLLVLYESPDLALLCSQRHRLAWVYFGSYFALLFFFMMNIFLAVVYTAYRNNIKADAVEFLTNRRAALALAFTSLDIKNKGFVGRSTTGLVILEASRYVKAPPNIAATFGNERIAATLLDADNDGRIGFDDFAGIIQILHTRIETDVPIGCWPVRSWWPEFYASDLYFRLLDALEHWAFDLAVLCVILLNALVTGVEIYFVISGMQQNEGPFIWMQMVFALVYLAEMAVKILVLGWERYWEKYSNRFDFLVNLSMVVVSLLLLVPDQGLSDSAYIRPVLFCRVLWFTRFFWQSQAFREVFDTMYQLAPVINVLIGILFPIFAEFAFLGVHMYGGILPVSSPAFKDTGLSTLYATSTFNDFPTALVTEFQLIIGGFTAIMRLHAAASSMGSWCALFFLTFYIVVSKVAVSNIVSFILEAYGRKEKETLARQQKPAGGSDSVLSDGLPPEGDKGPKGGYGRSHSYTDGHGKLVRRTSGDYIHQRSNSVIYDVVAEEIDSSLRRGNVQFKKVSQATEEEANQRFKAQLDRERRELALAAQAAANLNAALAAAGTAVEAFTPRAPRWETTPDLANEASPLMQNNTRVSEETGAVAVGHPPSING